MERINTLGNERKFKFFVIVIMLLAAITVIAWKNADSREWHEDHVYIKQLIENIAENGTPTSDAQDAINDLLFSGKLVAKSEELCAATLNSKSHSKNLFEYHPYYILYAIAPLSKIIPTESLLAILTVSGFFILLYLNFSIMQSNSVKFGITSSVLLIFAMHPAWSQALQGQYYVERFFIPVAALLIWLVIQKRLHYIAIVITCAVCALITERTGAVAGIFLIAYAVLYNKEDLNKRLFLFVLGLCSLILSVVIITYFLDNQSYTSGFLPSSLSQLHYRITDERYTSKLFAFLYFNILLIFIIAIFDWRAFLIAIGFMIPNIVGDIGGAEKTGFATHYHSLYLPFLFWAISSGAVKASAYLSGVPDKNKNIYIYASLITVVVLMTVTKIEPDANMTLTIDNVNNNAVYNAVKTLPECYGNGMIAKRNLMISKIQSSVPEKAKVAVSFWGFPILEHKRELYYYPLGIDTVDYVLLQYKKENDKYFYYGVVNYLGEKVKHEIDSCMNNRLKELGFNVENPMIFNCPLCGINEYALLKKL